MDIHAGREYAPGEIGMDLVHTHCAGLDVHKKTVVTTIIVSDPKGGLNNETRTFGTMTADLLVLSDWLTEQGARMRQWNRRENIGNRSSTFYRTILMCCW